MKQLKFAFLAILAVGIFSCEPVEHREELPEVNLQAAELDFSVTQNPERDNDLILQNNTADVIPYWHYENSNGDDLGSSNKETVNISFPFAGTYSIYFTAFTRGGSVEANPVEVTVSENDATSFSAEEWEMLTNGIEGKTWVLDMTSPIGWAGLDYPDAGDNWTWFPAYSGNEWVMENKDWGEMTFNLNGGYNVSVTQTELNSNEQSTKSGSFNYNIENHTISFNGGVELLYGGDYYPDVSNWTTINVTELSENSLSLAVLRDQSRTGEGPAQIVFHYKPKEE